MTVTYDASTTTLTRTEIPGRAPDVEQSSELRISHRVLASGETGSLIGIEATYKRVTQNGLAAPAPDPIRATYQVDRSGHAFSLATDTARASDEARLGIPEITAPFPNRRVRPGSEWEFAVPAGRKGFDGQARLVRLDYRRGVPVALIEALLTTEIEDTEIRGRDGPVTIGGPMTLSLRGVYEIRTGLLVESHQELTGEFRLRFTLEGSVAPPVAGSQRLSVVTDTHRAS